MNYDDVLVHLGKFGKYQLRNYILLCLPVILCAFHKLSGVFILGIPDHRCKLPNEPVPISFNLSSDILNQSYPLGVDNKFSKCEYFTKNYFNENITINEVAQCSDYVWDTSKYESSAVKSFSLVCDSKKLKPTSDALLMVGVFMGSFLFGQASDKYGRKIVFVISLAFQLIFGLLVAISPEFYTYAISRMVSKTINYFCSVKCKVI
jgi:MFS transporter, OCT family, solute carrier family 22 (organic cation transporter), member 4/5